MEDAAFFIMGLWVGLVAGSILAVRSLAPRRQTRQNKEYDLVVPLKHHGEEREVCEMHEMAEGRQPKFSNN